MAKRHETRFNRLVAKLRRRGDVHNARALAAWIGRRKDGARQFERLAEEGKRRAEHAHTRHRAHRKRRGFRWDGP